MCELLRYPDGVHVDASAFAEASFANLSAERPADRAVRVQRTAHHHSAGIERLCHHLLTKLELTPISAAIASREGHSSMIARNDDRSAMDISLRHLVLDCKPILSGDASPALGQNVPMEKRETRSEFTANFLGRTAASRKLKYETQQEMADALDIAQSLYGKYESRGPIPHYLMQRFCQICGVRTEWLLTGAGPGPFWQPVYPEQKKRRSARSKQKAKIRKIA